MLLEPDYEVETFSGLRIDGPTTTLIKAGLNKDDCGFLLPLAEHPWHRECTQSYCIEISLVDGRRLIVPRTELIRFYFGSSSGLIDAWRSAVSIGTSLLKGAATGQQTFPHTFFPFEGLTDLVASGKWVSLGGTASETFVIFNLRSCSHPFPFQSLGYEEPGTPPPA